ncbi:TonB-dependent receptor [Sphingopyxis sp. GW247-27LB]|uniref:TonB-dependent receptor n=1 Tax=Sphingopyxis sp. GW247-27LB TaxID=2012632 RepID=UPI000BA551D5|nr:TonB-dependent receptor [Sphingopyxis sp. GW247-27LB]PAL23237.1 TonB-dependent receptor [Sphingopyxis sp. GW247-27LB]
MRLLPSASLTLALMLSAPAFAQDGASDDDVHTGDAIVVTAPYVRSLDILGNVSVVEGDELARDIRGQIGDTLTRQPGVSATSFSPGASRPVLRGFSGERVKILTDGIGSIDASNTSADHAVTIDPLTVERVEILRGPAVLLFGSQAIGGAVNLFDRRIPRKVPADHVHVDAIGGYATAANDRNIGSSIDVALSPQIVAHVDGSWRKTGDTRSGGFVYAPDIRGDLLHLAEHAIEDGHADEAAELTAQANKRGKIDNTQSETWTAGGGLSLINDGGQLGISIGYFDTDYGVPDRPDTAHDHGGEDEEGGHDHGEGPVTIGMKQWRADLRGEVELGDGFFDKLRIRAGFADYKHTEFEGEEVGTIFTNQGVESRIELAQNDRGGWRGASGVQYSHRDFNAVGEEAFVPRNLTDQFALFTLQEYTAGPLGLEAAARYEKTSVRAQTVGFDRDFDSFSGALGVTYDIFEGAKFGISASRAVRAPSAEELLSNGPHIATQSFEVGDPNLKRESNWGAEASFKLKSDAFNLSLTGYSNWFDNFIYSAATGAEEDELPVFQYFQRDARVYGFEAEASARLAQIGGFNIVGDVTADMTRAKIKGAGLDRNVPRIPPLRVLGGLEAQSERLDARVEVEWTDDQARVAQFETPTDGFTLVNASLSWRPLPDARHLTLSLSANNIFDVEARRHASFTKDYVPLAGRDFRLTARASF